MWYSSESEKAVCNENGSLDEFDLTNSNIVGFIPWADLATLSDQLKVLDFFSNEISGSLPSQIGLLTNLVSIDMNTNQLSGALPTALGSLINVKYFDLSNNVLSGSIPLAISGMQDVETVRLDNNPIVGQIPSSMGQLMKMKNLYLKNTLVTGTMPQEICNLPLLENLEASCSAEFSCDCCTNIECSNSVDPLRDLIAANSPVGVDGLNDATSPQSKALAWLKSSDNEGITSQKRLLQRYALATLFYSTNGGDWNTNFLWVSSADECAWFSTSSSSTVCDQEGMLVELDLRENNLGGTFPAEVVMLSEGLETLRLPQNAMAGTLPSILSELSMLHHLDVSENIMSGELPMELGLFGSALTHLTVFDNAFASTIPTELGRLTALQVLDLGSNQLKGTIPSEFSLMLSLSGLSFFDNQLTGPVPCDLKSLNQLTLFFIDSNDLGPPICDEICGLGFVEFWSDCSEVQCSCCTTCCDDGFGCIAQ
jgi:Leucine-rich repeat (LRR) protein